MPARPGCKPVLPPGTTSLPCIFKGRLVALQGPYRHSTTPPSTRKAAPVVAEACLEQA